MLTRQHAVSTSGQQFPKLRKKTKRNIKLLLRTTGKKESLLGMTPDRFIDTDSFAADVVPYFIFTLFTPLFSFIT